ncbi:MAG: endonuclease/exonuclease/phosphatase family protein [Planctomycetes bacterium]|nr:endonuclease/exonuclease/phosphatase family protein [Planctomycetota bacterium]
MKTLSTVANGIAFFALVPSLLAYLGEFWWRFHLWEHLRPHYGMALAAAVVLAVLARRWRWAAFWVAAVAANGLLLFPLLPLGGASEPIAGPRLRVLHANLHVQHPDPDRLLEWVEGLDRDLVLLHEFTPVWRKRVQQVCRRYRLELCDPQVHPTGTALLLPVEARQEWRLVDSSILQMTQTIGERPVMELVLEAGGRGLAVLSFHATRPISWFESRGQERDFRFAADWALGQRALGRETLVLGDFNSTPWSSRFRGLLRDAELEDSLVGRGMQGSWPSFLPSFLRLPIDHAVHSSGLVVAERRLGPEVGSDHLPLLIEIGFRP